jgi:hypothetical protein
MMIYNHFKNFWKVVILLLTAVYTSVYTIIVKTKEWGF